MLCAAAGPVSWGVDFADDPGNPPWEQVLDAIRDAGLRALELGPHGYLPRHPHELRPALRARGLAAAGSFLVDDLHDASRRDACLRDAERVCRWIASAGGAILVIIDRPDEARAASAGRTGAARRLDARRWSEMMRTIDRVATTARRHGLRPTLHPHAGSHIEFEDEIEAALRDTDVELCLDTGHALYAGVDPVALLDRHHARVAHLHLKDVDSRVLADPDAGYWEQVRAGVFCPLGDGALDLAALSAALRRHRVAGFATIEQDRRSSTAGDPVEDLRTSIERLRRAGILPQ
jgi:inosose dehydratase